jgi:DNA replication protein DnaC
VNIRVVSERVEVHAADLLLACTIGQAAIRLAHKTRYYRIYDLLYETNLARQDGIIFKLRTRLAKYELVILDDLGVYSDEPASEIRPTSEP